MYHSSTLNAVTWAGCAQEFVTYRLSNCNGVKKPTQKLRANISTVYLILTIERKEEIKYIFDNYSSTSVSTSYLSTLCVKTEFVIHCTKCPLDRTIETVTYSYHHIFNSMQWYYELHICGSN